MDENTWQKWFEGIWADREERIYRAYFGDLGPGIYTMNADTFKQIGLEEFDPRWLHHGVFECPPTDKRPHWLYVTSGMSNPWGESPETVKPENFSGLGFEFTVHAKERGRWPILLLHWLMAVQLGVAAGAFQGGLIEYNDRAPLGAPLAGKEGGLITHIAVTVPPAENEGGHPRGFELASGKVDLMLVLGITSQEKDFARTQGAEALLNLLRHHGIFPLTDPGRVSLI